MSLNGLTLNNAALNSAAFLVLVYAEVASAASGCTATVDGSKAHFVSVTSNAAVTVSLTQQHVIAARVLAFVDTALDAEPVITWAGASNGIASCSSSVLSSFVSYRTALGSGYSEGSAISNSKLGTSSATAGSTLEAAANKGQSLVSSTTAGCSGAADPACTRYVHVAAHMGCAGQGDWKYQATGTTYWLFDGTVTAYGTMTHGFTASTGRVEVGNAFSAVAGSSMAATGRKAIIAGASNSAGSTLSATGGFIGYAFSWNVATSTFAMPSVRTHYGSGSGEGISSLTVVNKKVNTAFKATAVNNAGIVAQVYDRRQNRVRVSSSASMTGVAAATRIVKPEVLASMAVNVTATGFANYMIPAPASRGMYVPNDDRQMVVPFEDRIMRLAA